jgi:hypothetical protein
MRGYVGLSKTDLKEIHTSELLGGLFGVKFLPKEGSNGWGCFSQPYLNTLLSYANLNLVLSANHRYERETKLFVTKSKYATKDQLEKSTKRAKGMGGFFAAQGANV